MEPEIKETVKEVRLVGELRAVDLKDDGGGTFRLRLEDGSEVSGEFDEFYEAIITRNLHNHKWNRMGIRGEGKFDAAGKLCQFVTVKEFLPVDLGEEPIYSDSPPPPAGESDNGILEMVRELHKKYPIPEEERQPSNFAKNYRNYRSGIFEEEDDSDSGSTVPADTGAGKSIGEIIKELQQTELWRLASEEKLPPDFAANYRHYLYGFPKDGDQ